MYYSKIRKYDVSNAPGVRTTLFVSGCTNDCEGCFNKELQDFKYGTKWTDETEDEFMTYVKNPNVVGVNILGGEPMQQDLSLLKLLIRIKQETNKNIWLWSGFTYEYIINNVHCKKILNYIDVLVDGKFEIDKKDLSLKYRGSSNQRIISVQKSLKENKIILYNK